MPGREMAHTDMLCVVIPTGCQKRSICLPAVFSLAAGKNATTQCAPREGCKAGRFTVWTLHNTKSIRRASTGAQDTGQTFNATFSNAGILKGSPGICHWEWNQTSQFKIAQHQNSLAFSCKNSSEQKIFM